MLPYHQPLCDPSRERDRERETARARERVCVRIQTQRTTAFCIRIHLISIRTNRSAGPVCVIAFSMTTFHPGRRVAIWQERWQGNNDWGSRHIQGWMAIWCVCACVCVFAYEGEWQYGTCMCVCVCECVCVCVWVCMSVCECVCACMWVGKVGGGVTCECECACVCAGLCLPVYVCTPVCLWVWLCMYAYMYEPTPPQPCLLSVSHPLHSLAIRSQGWSMAKVRCHLQRVTRTRANGIKTGLLNLSSCVFSTYH